MFLKNKNIIFKIRRSKITDYAALTVRQEKASHFLSSNFVCPDLCITNLLQTIEIHYIEVFFRYVPCLLVDIPDEVLFCCTIS